MVEVPRKAGPEVNVESGRAVKAGNA